MRSSIERASIIAFQSMPTSFQLKPDQVDELVNVGAALLDESPGFQEFLKAFSPP